MKNANAYMNKAGKVLSAVDWIRSPLATRREYFVRLVVDNGGINTPPPNSDSLVAEIRELVVERNETEGLSNDDFKRAQKTLGLKNLELCELLNISEATLCNWKNNRVPIPGPACIAVRLLLKLQNKTTQQ